MKVSLLFRCFLAVCCSETAIASGPSHPVTLEDLETLKSTYYLRLSPSGDLLAFVEDGKVRIIPTTQTGGAHELGQGDVPVWSPDGSRLAYYSNQSGSLQLWVFELRSGHSEQVTNLAGGIDPDPYTRLLGWTEDPLKYSWSPSGDQLVFASRVTMNDVEPAVQPNESTAAAGSPLVLTRTTPADWTLSGIFQSGGFGSPAFSGGEIDFSRKATNALPKANELFVVDVAAKVSQQLTQDRMVYFNPEWSPDGLTLVCASSEGRSLVGYGAGTTNLYLIDVRTGRKKALTHSVGDKRMPSWSADGRWIAYLGNEHFGLQQLFLVSVDGTRPMNLSSSLNRYVDEFSWDWATKAVLITYQDGVALRLARLGIENNRVEELLPGGSSLRLHPSASRTGDVAWEETNGAVRGLLKIKRRVEKDSEVIANLNPQIASWTLGIQEIKRWKNSRGDLLEGVLIKPIHYQRGKRYPLIVDAYPAQPSGFKGYAMTGNQAWASRGYAVFWPNARAPHVWMNPFKSKEFDQAGKGVKGLDVMVDDVVSGISELVKEGIADPTRIGVYGFSNGGAVVDQLITRTHIFKCAVSVAAATGVDWWRPFFLHTADPMIPTTVGALPWEDRQAYSELSALTRLNKVTIPVLLADGDNDGEFLLNSIEMYNGLRYLGRDVTFLRYKDQGHGFTGDSLRDFWERENAFFDKYLKPEQLLN
jgi:dipeptidyl aminopeptidase/acylaminoacyl peptidase